MAIRNLTTICYKLYTVAYYITAMQDTHSPGHHATPNLTPPRLGATYRTCFL